MLLIIFTFVINVHFFAIVVVVSPTFRILSSDFSESLFINELLFYFQFMSRKFVDGLLSTY